MYTASLNSGSNGNCYYIGNEKEAVLIDAGISCRETEKRMARLGLHIRLVKAIFVSHEHSDHIKGVSGLSKKYRIPVYINKPTLLASGLVLNWAPIHSFQPDEVIRIGALTVIPFSKSHDASYPFSFVVRNESICVGVMTDIGHVCDNVIRYFKECHAVFLEANYDVTMLETGPYPISLKRRISSDKGHLSNDQALELFIRHRSPFLSHVFLSHLSKENNHPELATAAFQKHRGDVHVIAASRYEETALFHITRNDSTKALKTIKKEGLQMALFN